MLKTTQQTFSIAILPVFLLLLHERPTLFKQEVKTLTETHQVAADAAVSCKHRGSLFLSVPRNEPP